METSIRTTLRISNCSSVTVTEVGCGPQLIGCRQHLSASDHILAVLLDHPRVSHSHMIPARMVD